MSWSCLSCETSSHAGDDARASGSDANCGGGASWNYGGKSGPGSAYGSGENGPCGGLGPFGPGNGPCFAPKSS